MERILSKIILHPKIKYSEAIGYPKLLTDFLKNKLLTLKQHRKGSKYGFDIDKDIISSKDSIDFLTYGLNVLL